MLESKKTMSEMKKSFDGFKSRLVTAEEDQWIKDRGNYPNINIKKKKQWGEKEQSIWELWGNAKRLDISSLENS